MAANTKTIHYREQRPDDLLRPSIECIWMVWDAKRHAARAPEHVIPDACPEIIVHLGDPFARRSGQRWKQQPAAFLAGTLTAPWTLRAGPTLCTLGIRFRPGGLTSIWPFDMALATDREVALSAVTGMHQARDLVQRLRAARGQAGCFRAAAGWLIEQRAAAPATRPTIARAAVQHILQSRGQGRIETMAADLGTGRRRLERAFARHLGIRPKLFARIVRLNAVLATLGTVERQSLVQIALAAGYFDQAHLARDFQAVVQRTARTDRTLDGDMAHHFTRPERLLALLAGE